MKEFEDHTSSIENEDKAVSSVSENESNSYKVCILSNVITKGANEQSNSSENELLDIEETASDEGTNVWAPE